jgi:hypothetical protein
VTDASSRWAQHDPSVKITIRLDELDPPVGRVSVVGGREVDFVGWLGLIRALSELFEAPVQ